MSSVSQAATASEYHPSATRLLRYFKLPLTLVLSVTLVLADLLLLNFRSHIDVFVGSARWSSFHGRYDLRDVFQFEDLG